MSVAQDELLFHSSTVGSSQGGASTGVAYSNVKGAFFSNVTDIQRLAGGTQTKKWFLFNDAPVDSLIAPTIWLQNQPTYVTEEIGLGFDSADDADAGQGNMTAFSGNAVISVQSSASDTRTVTAYGLNATGNPISEAMVLTGTTPKLGLLTFSVVYGAMVSAAAGGLTVTLKEGSGGTTRGTIGPSKKCCWLWVNPISDGAGILLPNLPAQTNYGFWDRLTWPASVTGVRPNNSIIAVRES